MAESVSHAQSLRENGEPVKPEVPKGVVSVAMFVLRPRDAFAAVPYKNVTAVP
jgi:hypothetical protein